MVHDGPLWCMLVHDERRALTHTDFEEHFHRRGMVQHCENCVIVKDSSTIEICYLETESHLPIVTDSLSRISQYKYQPENGSPFLTLSASKKLL